MKSILIQQSHNKFLQNCLSTIFEDILTIDIIIGNNLYQAFFKHKPDYCLFSADMITQEILQFCEDYHNDTSIYIYSQDSDSYDKAKTIIPESLRIIYIGYSDENDIIIPKDMVNDQLFLDIKSNRKDSIVCFMDSMPNIPDELLNILYPNTKEPIKLFNCPPQTRHYQNLGLISEKDRASILQTHKYYLCLNQQLTNSYINEAIACGCIPISIDDIKQQLYQTKLLPKQDSSPQTYSHFLRNILKL